MPVYFAANINTHLPSLQLLRLFRRAMLSIPEVMECHLVSGDFDYLIKARIPEMTEYRRLLGEILHVADGGQSKSYVVMDGETWMSRLLNMFSGFR